MLLDCAVILGSEAIAERCSLGFAASKILANGDDNKDEYSHRNHDLGIREVIGHGILLCGIPATAKIEWERLRRRERNPTQNPSWAAMRVNTGLNCTP
jgi:hypothetical protein